MQETVTLTVQLLRSTIDARRGIARIHRRVLDAMGLKPYSPITVTGVRTTSALVALSPPRSLEGVIHLDALGCLNAGVTEGAEVTCRPVFPQPARRIVLAFPASVAYPDGRAVSAVLSGKVVSEGDRVSLLPQDYTRTPNGVHVPVPAITDAVAYLMSVLGEGWKSLDLVLAEVTPGPVALVTPGTEIAFTRSTPWEAAGPPSLPRLEDLGGIEPQVKLLEEWLGVSFEGTEVLARMGLNPPDGVLIYGPPGSGKSSLVAAMAAHLGAALSVVYGAHLARWNPNQAADYLRQLLRSVSAPPRQIVLIEDIDQLAPNPQLEGKSGTLTPVLIDEVRSCNAKPCVAIVATTTDRFHLDPGLTGPGLLENELEMPVPRKAERLAILSIHTRSMPLADDVSLQDLAERTPGFVGADLRLLCQKAAAISLIGGPFDGRDPHTVSHRDFIAALGQVRPTAVADRQVEVGGVSFDDVGDMQEVKGVLEETVLWPLRFPETMRRYGLKTPRGILLYGPPGCGKTYVMRALANESGAAFFAVRGPELLSKWVGESERAVRDLFHKAETAAPSILLIDEIDSIAPPRGRDAEGSTDRVVGQLLSLLDGLDQLGDIWVVAATNRPDMVDPALLRPGRLERRVFVGPPDTSARLDILRALTRQLPLADEVDLESIALRTKGYSGADLEAMVRKAMVASVRATPENPVVDMARLLEAIESTAPSISPEALAAYESFAEAVIR